jgi:AraC-like DNA-binding protein
MRILELVSDEAATRMDASVRPGDLVTRFASAESFERALTATPMATVVFDPMFLRADLFSELLTICGRRPGHVIIATPLGGIAPNRILAAVRAGVSEVIFNDVENDPALVRLRLAEPQDCSAAGLVLRRLVTAIALLPRQLQMHVVAIFAGGQLPRSTTAFIASSSLRARTLTRYFADAGLRTASRLLRSARVARTWDLLADQRARIAEVAVYAGYSSTRQMRIHFAKVLGRSPYAVARELDIVQFSDSVARHALQRERLEVM